MLGKTTNDNDRHFTDLELLVVQCDEERADILRLSKVAVKLLLRAKLTEHGPSELGIGVRDTDRHELVEHIIDDFDSMHAGLTADGIVNKEVGTGLGGGLAYRSVIVLEVGERAVSDKLIEDVTLEVESPERLQCNSDGLDTLGLNCLRGNHIAACICRRA